MQVDIGPALDEATTPGIPEPAWERLDERIAATHRLIGAERATGSFGYAALDPDPPIDRIREVTQQLPVADELLIAGIGGSALPAKALSMPLVEDTGIDVTLLDNADPTLLRRSLAAADPDDTVLNVVSRSGTTAETLVNFREVRSWWADAGVDWRNRTVITTGESGPLRSFASEEGVPTLPAPRSAPGRFGIFSPVGLLPLVLGDGNAEGVIAGAREAADRLEGSVHSCPPYAIAAVIVGLARRRADTTVLWPYSDALQPMIEWTAQLFAESLGKDGIGITPIRARGTTDQHAHLQLYRAGPRDKLAIFFDVDDREIHPVSEEHALGPSAVATAGVGELQTVSRRATTASLARDGRPAVTVTAADLSPRSVGRLAYDMMVTTITVGELLDVTTFDQPAVEWGKRAARGLLGDPDCESEADAVTAIPTRIVD